MKFIVGGEEYDLTRQQVERAMKNVPPESFQKYIVEMLGTVFPPKQVFAQVTGRGRTSFTTQEAQRVLTKLGFVCREAGQLMDGTPAWMPVKLEETASPPSTTADRVVAVESGLATALLAIAELQRRVVALEANRPA